MWLLLFFFAHSVCLVWFGLCVIISIKGVIVEQCERLMCEFVLAATFFFNAALLCVFVVCCRHHREVAPLLYLCFQLYCPFLIVLYTISHVNAVYYTFGGVFRALKMAHSIHTPSYL